MDIVDRGVDALVKLEPALKGKESQVAAILVMTLIEKAREDGQTIAMAQMHPPENRY